MVPYKFAGLEGFEPPTLSFYYTLKLEKVHQKGNTLSAELQAQRFGGVDRIRTCKVFRHLFRRQESHPLLNNPLCLVVLEGLEPPSCPNLGPLLDYKSRVLPLNYRTENLVSVDGLEPPTSAPQTQDSTN